MATWFIDTGFAIALCVQKDRFHAQAALLATEIERQQTTLLTTHAVILEIGAALSKIEFRKQGSALIRSLLADPSVRVLPSDDLLLGQALSLFELRADKNWSLCDCTSFVVMRQYGLTQALSTDHHFDQAGFNALLLREGLPH